MSRPASEPTSRRAELQLAVMLLTRLPAGRIEGEAPPLASARWAFPVVGAIVGLIGWAVHAAALALDVPDTAAAVLSVSALALVTGALHFDGLGDFQTLRLVTNSWPCESRSWKTTCLWPTGLPTGCEAVGTRWTFCMMARKHTHFWRRKGPI